MNTPAPAPAPPRIPVRIRTGEIFEMTGNHVSTWGVLTDHAWADIFEPNYLLPIADWFIRKNPRGPQMDWRPDEIKVYRAVRPSNEALYYEACTVIVTYASKSRVTVAPLYDPLVVGAPEGTAASWPAAVAPPPQPADEPKRPSRQHVTA